MSNIGITAKEKRHCDQYIYWIERAVNEFGPAFAVMCVKVATEKMAQHNVGNSPQGAASLFTLAEMLRKTHEEMHEHMETARPPSRT